MIKQISNKQILKEEKIGETTRHYYIDIDSELGQQLVEDNDIVIDEDFNENGEV